MALVSLIGTVVRGKPPAVAELSPFRTALETVGHHVEIVIVTGPGVAGPDLPGPSDATRWEPCRDWGRVAAAVHGLLLARGDYLVVLDPFQNYRPADVVRVVEALEAGKAPLVLGCRWVNDSDVAPKGSLRLRLGEFARKVFGTADPFSGLVGLTRDGLRESAGGFRAVGSQFALELLGRVKGERLDVPARPGPARRWSWPGFDDIRHLKRLADDRYGNVSRLLQFCLVGASGMVIDLSTYALFQWIFARTALAGQVVRHLGALDLVVAAVLAIALALTWNFSLNRRLTFNDARSGSILRQFLAYVLSNAVAISLNLTLRLQLPKYVAFFDRHKLVAAIVGIVMATGLSFSMSRWLVFQKRRPIGPPDEELTQHEIRRDPPVVTHNDVQSGNVGGDTEAKKAYVGHL